MLTSSDSNKYAIFEDAYETATTEKDLPSNQGSDKADDDHKHLLISGRVRGVIVCGDLGVCHKALGC